MDKPYPALRQRICGLKSISGRTGPTLRDWPSLEVVGHHVDGIRFFVSPVGKDGVTNYNRIEVHSVSSNQWGYPFMPFICYPY